MMGDTGIAVLALTIALTVVTVSVELLKRFVFKRNGNGIKTIVCPNKVEGIAEVLSNVKQSCKVNSEAIHNIHTGVEHLVEQHAANEDGVLTWKIQPRFIELWEKSTQQQQVIVACLSRITASTEKMVDLQRETIAILKQNGGKT